MQKWEYIVVEEDGYRARTINKQEIKDWRKGPDIMTFMTGLGDEGWEVYHVISSGSQWLFFLKRPKN